MAAFIRPGGHKMKGINYVVDEGGHKTAVMIDLTRLHSLWEDFYDSYLAEKRASEPRESLEDVKKRLIKSGESLSK
jgi:hypothetical protein